MNRCYQLLFLQYKARIYKMQTLWKPYKNHLQVDKDGDQYVSTPLPRFRTILFGKLGLF